MIKPIEVGCMAIIVRSTFPENVGVQVTVVAHEPSDPDGYVWQIEAAEAVSGAPGGLTELRSKFKLAWAQTADLLRIDSFDEPDIDDTEIVDQLAWQSF